MLYCTKLLNATALTYCSCSMSTFLRIDTDTNVVTTFGKVSEEKNKYQGGTLAGDGFIYAIPSNANDILCIDTNNPESGSSNDENGEISFLDQDAAFTIGDIYESTQTKRKDKWQGKLRMCSSLVVHVVST